MSNTKLNTYYVVLNITGKFGITIGHCILYIWSAEVYPTSLRTTLMGINSVMGKLGSILAPLVANLVSCHTYMNTVWLSCKM